MIPFDPSAFSGSLRYMGVGMLGIFLVMGVVVAMVLLLGWLTRSKE